MCGQGQVLGRHENAKSEWRRSPFQELLTVVSPRLCRDALSFLPVLSLFPCEAVDVVITIF